MAFDLIHVAS